MGILRKVSKNETDGFDGAWAESGGGFVGEIGCDGVGDGQGGVRRSGGAVVGAYGIEQGHVVREFVKGKLGVAVFVWREGRARAQRGEL